MPNFYLAILETTPLFLGILMSPYGLRAASNKIAALNQMLMLLGLLQVLFSIRSPIPNFHLANLEMDPFMGFWQPRKASRLQQINKLHKTKG